MMQASNEYTTVDFNCPAVSRTVQFTREYKLQVTRSGKFLGRAMAGSDCSDKSQCPVCAADAASPDWTKCLFLHPAPLAT